MTDLINALLNIPSEQLSSFTVCLCLIILVVKVPKDSDNEGGRGQDTKKGNEVERH